MRRFGVLASGAGTNLQAILEAWQKGELPGEPAVVVSNRPGAGVLTRAGDFGVPAQILDHRPFPSREAFEQALAGLLDAHRVELVVMAGFMRVLTPWFVRRYPGRILNTHPALLPAFPGHRAPAEAIEARVRVSGCTVHFVDEGVDTGPVIAQGTVPVEPTDTPEVLADRIRAVEHRLYPRVIVEVLAGRIRLEGGRVVYAGAVPRV
jgi:phosphoribosylglycinamide formyltransferase-1